VYNGIDYHHQVMTEDRLEVSSTVEKIGMASFTAVSIISTTSRRCAIVRTVQVVLSEGRSSTRAWTAEERHHLAKATGPTEPGATRG
jgi:acyl-CoA thioesterase FadM